MAWDIWFWKTQAGFKTCLPCKAVYETYLVSVQSHDGQNALGLQHASWELGRHQDVGYNPQSIQVFGCKFCSLRSPGNSRYFDLLESGKLFVVESEAWKSWEHHVFVSRVILISVRYFLYTLAMFVCVCLFSIWAFICYNYMPES